MRRKAPCTGLHLHRPLKIARARSARRARQSRDFISDPPTPLRAALLARSWAVRLPPMPFSQTVVCDRVDSEHSRLHSSQSQITDVVDGFTNLASQASR